MRWAGPAAHMGGEKRCILYFGGVNLKERNFFEDLSIYWMQRHGLV